jgi:hypothetical protein
MSSMDHTRKHSAVWGPALQSIAGCACLLAAAAAKADDPDRLNDPWVASLGTFILNQTTTLRVDGELSQGTPLNWDKAFGDEGDQNRIRLDGFWRFADRHKVRAMAFSANRSDTRQFERDIEFEDEIFPVGASVKGEVDFSIYELAYEYDFLRRDTWEIGASFGVHYTQYEVALSATVTTPGGSGSGSRKAEADLHAPLPVIGLHGMWGFGHNLWLDASAQLFSLSIDEDDGNVQDDRIGLIWQPKSWAGLGLGYNFFSMDLDVDSSGFKGSLDWEYDGPQIFYTVAF